MDGTQERAYCGHGSEASGRIWRLCDSSKRRSCRAPPIARRKSFVERRIKHELYRSILQLLIESMDCYGCRARMETTVRCGRLPTPAPTRQL